MSFCSYEIAVVDSDHNPVVATAAVKLKKVLRAKNGVKWNLEKLKDKDSYSSLEFRTGVELALEKLIEQMFLFVGYYYIYILSSVCLCT